jgi:hypothetical protein
MWDDVIVGKGPHICSAVTCYEGPDTKVHISENQNSYWINDLILGEGMKIFKDTRQGQKLTKLLEAVKTNGEYEYKIYNFLNGILLKRIKPDMLMEYIRSEREKAYEQGKEMKADEIRRALGILEY